MARNPRKTAVATANLAKKGKKPSNPSAKGRGRAASAKPAPAREVQSDDNIRASFLHHLTAWRAAQSKVAVARKIEKEMVASAKADGFLKKEFQVAEALAGSPKKEARVVAEVSLRQRVAQWIGHPMGKQLDLFAQNREVLIDPRDEGKQCCMEGGRASPPSKYSPGSIPYTQWLEGFHAEQERKVRGGIKPLGGNGELDDGDGEQDGDGNPVAAVGADPARPLSSDFEDFPSDVKH